MIQPGKQTNLPTSSAVGLQGLMGQSIYKVDGFSITIGIIVLILAGFLVWQMMVPKRKR